jgi:hypothetical protein
VTSFVAIISFEEPKMQNGQIIRAFIAGPSDVRNEKRKAIDVIAQWNVINSLKESTVIEPVTMETHAEAVLGAHPQELINSQLLNRCDFLLAIFRSRLGTPTPKEKSGTIDEIREFSKRRGPDRVSVFFADKNLPRNVDRKQIVALWKFRDILEQEGIIVPFRDAADFGVKLRYQIECKAKAVRESIQGAGATASRERELADNSLREGLIRIGRSRLNTERRRFLREVLETAKEETEIVAVGRSLIDWSLHYESIEEAINGKKLRLRIALLDENTLRDKSAVPDELKNPSWIEKPIASDWAISDVPRSMERLRSVKVLPESGSLEIYGLPFYTFSSFVSYVDKTTGVRRCFEELGLARSPEKRPFLELEDVSSDCYADALYRMYTSFMTDERLLICKKGCEVSRDTTRRHKIIGPKVERYGLVDLAVGRANIDSATRDLSEVIANVPRGGEIFIVGRSLVIWANHHIELADAIIDNGINCVFVIADEICESLVTGDYAKNDVPVCWKQFERNLLPILKERGNDASGTLDIYEIPCYVPITFASIDGKEGKYCSLEAGIALAPASRPFLRFAEVSPPAIYTHLYTMYKGILKKRRPRLSWRVS